MDSKLEYMRLKSLALANASHNWARFRCYSALDQAPVALLEESCSDCGEPAAVRDHRDYRQPFQTEPVCLSCNRRRGRALP